MGHNHNHSHEVPKGKKLLWVTLLNFIITVVQIIGGIMANSLSLLSDALHNLGDTSALFIAFIAGKKGAKGADKSKTFGYKRIEILAALFNSITLIAISIYLFYEAYKRFLNPEPIKGKLMIIVAVIGLLGNLFSVLLLQKDKDSNLNTKAAYLHLMGDTLASVAVIIGGVAIWLFDIIWIDPLITILVGVFIIHHTWSVVDETVSILMQAAPANLDLKELEKTVLSFDAVQDMHHLHLWQMDDAHVHLEAHINLKENMDIKAMMKIREEIMHKLMHDFNISHITLQMAVGCCSDNTGLVPEVD
jgi:cobalt-zinc-cadmium efflux system protein